MGGGRASSRQEIFEGRGGEGGEGTDIKHSARFYTDERDYSVKPVLGI